MRSGQDSNGYEETSENALPQSAKRRYMNDWCDGTAVPQMCLWTPTQLQCPQLQGCSSVADSDLWPPCRGRGFEYHVDVKGQGESLEQLVILHQPDWIWCALTQLQARVQWRGKPTKSQYEQTFNPQNKDLTPSQAHSWRNFSHHSFLAADFLGGLWWSTAGGHSLPFFSFSAFKSSKSIWLLQQRNENHESITFISPITNTVKLLNG